MSTLLLEAAPNTVLGNIIVVSGAFIILLVLLRLFAWNAITSVFANRAKVLATANEEATSLKKRAQEDIEQERKEALNTIKGDVVDISVQIAEKLIGQSLDASAQQELIDSYLAKLGE